MSLSATQAFDEAAAALCAAGIGASLRHEQVTALCRALKPKRVVFTDGESICEPNHAADRFWVLTNGTIRITDEHTITLRHAPAMIGELALARGAAIRSAGMVALGWVEAWEVLYECVDGLSEVGLEGTFYRDLAGIAADKVAEAVTARAQQAAAIGETEAMLRRFVNRHALGATRTGVRDEYEKVCAVVWFSDLVGFSKLARSFSPEQTAELIRAATTAISDVIEAQGGHVDKFMADGVMAYWIVSTETDHHRGRQVAAAMRAALQARAAIAALASSDLPAGSLGIRIGIDLCSAQAGDFGSERRSAYTLIGDDVNSTARLEQARQEDVVNGTTIGTIRIGAVAWGHLDDNHRTVVPVQTNVRVKGADFTLYTDAKE